MTTSCVVDRCGCVAAWEEYIAKIALKDYRPKILTCSEEQWVEQFKALPFNDIRDIDFVAGYHSRDQEVKNRNDEFNKFANANYQLKRNQELEAQLKKNELMFDADLKLIGSQEMKIEKLEAQLEQLKHEKHYHENVECASLQLEVAKLKEELEKSVDRMNQIHWEVHAKEDKKVAERVAALKSKINEVFNDKTRFEYSKDVRKMLDIIIRDVFGGSK